MLTFTTGNILEDEAEALVNTVNCVGVMGKGIALQFKKAFPQVFDPYKKACEADEVQPGKMHVVELQRLAPPYLVINFPTKRHWRSNSRLDDVEAGLEDLARVVDAYDIDSIAIPPLGCGLGGLDWEDVRPLIEETFADFDEVDITIYEPGYTPDAEDMPVGTDRPDLTKARALFIKLIDLYRLPGYRSTRIEIQKLAYFLQTAGEKLQLRFARNQYGPYADNLRFVLQTLDGHFLTGVGDGKSRSEIRLADGAVEEAEECLNQDTEAAEHLHDVASVIEGFETPYGMELLGTVHWAATEAPDTVLSIDETVEAVRNWSPRKRKIFREDHIRKVYRHLEAGGWFHRRAVNN